MYIFKVRHFPLGILFSFLLYSKYVFNSPLKKNTREFKFKSEIVIKFRSLNRTLFHDEGQRPLPVFYVDYPGQNIPLKVGYSFPGIAQ